MTLLVSMAAVVVAAGAFYYQRASVPKRALEIKIGSPAPIATDAHGLGLTVTHGQVAIESPHITTLIIENSGRSDLSSPQFDEGRPLVIDFGVPVVEAIRTPDPAATFEPTWESTDSRISLGPTILPRTRTIHFQVLTDGRPQISCQAHLVDTRVNVSTLQTGGRNRDTFDWDPIIGISLGALFVTVIGLVIYGYRWHLDHHDSALSVSPTQAAPGQKVSVTGSHFEPGKTIYFGLQCLDYSTDTERLADASGRAVVSFTVPKKKTWATGEKCTLSASQNDTTNSATATFVVQSKTAS